MTSGFINSVGVETIKVFFEVDGNKVASALINPKSDNIFPYQGITLAPIAGKPHSIFNKQLKILSEFIKELTSKYKMLDFSLSHDFIDLRALLWFNYHEQEKGQFALDLNYTGIVNLKEEKKFENYLTSIRNVRRQEWNKCIKNQYYITESEDIDQFMLFYKLMFDNQNMELSDKTMAIVRGITTESLRNSFGKLTFCYDSQGNLLSSMLTLIYKDTAYYQFGVTNPEHKSSGASVFLVLNSIKSVYESNINFFDMVGINSPNRGDFKLSFNAIPVPYFNVKGNFSNN
jgi:hypothetical protein